MAKVKMWMRAGITIEVDKEAVFADPENALIEAIKRGDFKFDGDSYMPDEELEDHVDNGNLPESYYNRGIGFDL